MWPVYMQHFATVVCAPLASPTGFGVGVGSGQSRILKPSPAVPLGGGRRGPGDVVIAVATDVGAALEDEDPEAEEPSVPLRQHRPREPRPCRQAPPRVGLTDGQVGAGPGGHWHGKKRYCFQEKVGEN